MNTWPSQLNNPLILDENIAQKVKTIDFTLPRRTLPPSYPSRGVFKEAHYTFCKRNYSSCKNTCFEAKFCSLLALPTSPLITKVAFFLAKTRPIQFQTNPDCLDFHVSWNELKQNYQGPGNHFLHHVIHVMQSGISGIWNQIQLPIWTIHLWT